MTARDKIFKEIDEERAYQEGKFGTSFDERNTVNDWVTYIAMYAGKAAFAGTEAEARQQLMKVAALAVAAMESFDRNKKFAPRHYD